MLNRTVQKSSKLGSPGLIAIIVIGTILLPMGSRASNTQKQSRVHSEPNTIVPGLRVGDYTLGMSKDEVLSSLGKPNAIFYGGERYTLDNLPRRYFMIFDDVSFGMDDDSVKWIIVLSPFYKFTNGLGVGDSEQKIKQAFGDDFHFKGADFLAYEDEGLEFEIHKKNRTVMQINVSQTTGDHADSDAPNSGKSIMLNEQSPGPITFPKIDRKPNPFRWQRDEMKSLPKYDPNLDRSWQVDLRSYDLTKLDLRNSIEDLMYADFDDRTVWPAPNQMPSDFDWQKIMELGKNPGLGIRSLHKKGITGRGVRVAILDQPLLVDHQEYVERLRLYEEIDLQGLRRSTTQGAAVASIAVGKTVGVAPEAELYYIAQLNVDRDKGNTPTLRSLAKGIHRMLEINEQLPKDNKIRVISISGGWTRSHKDYKEITEAVQKARAAGMLVVCASVELVHDGFAFGSLGRSPLADPEVFESYEPGLFLAKAFRAGRLSLSEGHFWAPMDSRTTASPSGSDEYVFCRIGGFSWAIPYIAGVYALAVQVDPAITPERFWALAVQTGRTIELEHKGERHSFGPIIDPVRLIRSIKAGKLSNLIRNQSDNQHIRTRPQTNSETQTIVPGLRVGDYTLDMSKDEVLRKLGEPESIHFGGERYTLNNLPRRYIMSFSDIFFAINDDSVEGISVRSPLYKFSNGLGVGDSEQKIKQAFGNDFQLEEFEPKDLLNYEDKGLQFEIHKKKRTVMEIDVYQTKRNRSDRREAVTLSTLEPFDSVCGKDLRTCDLRNAGAILDTLEFNQETLWPTPDRLPEGFDPKVLLQEGMNPGLGIRALHAEGITGAGVHVGLIDQPLLLDHPEYAGKIVSYHDAGCGPSMSSMHGPAMASQLVGNQCGTAPGAKLHVVAVPSWKGDAGYYARALDRLVTRNGSVREDQKIRVVSVSTQPSGEGSKYINQSLWDQAVQRALWNSSRWVRCLVKE